MNVVPSRIGGEFGHVQRTEPYCARSVEPLRNRGVITRNEFASDFRTAGSDLAGAIEHVLVGERHAMQGRARFAARKRFVDLPCRR